MMGMETSHDVEKVAPSLAQETLADPATGGQSPVTFVCRYFDGYQHEKQLSVTEIAALEQGGIRIVSVWEKGYPTEVGYFTKERGIQDGKGAVQVAMQHGQPDGAPVYFAVDFDAYTAAHKQAILDYFSGVEEGMQDAWNTASSAGTVSPPVYPIGVYGSSLVLSWLNATGNVDYYWQAFAGHWSGDPADKRPNDPRPLNEVPWGQGAHLHTVGHNAQVLGVEVDPVAAVQDDYGGWNRMLS